MSDFGPWVGEKGRNAAQGGGNKRAEECPTVIGIDADIRKRKGLDRAQQFDDAIDERLTADKANIGMADREGREMLPTTEADFKPHLPACSAEERARIKRFPTRGQRDRNCWQELVEQTLLSGPQPFSLAPAIKTQRGGITHLRGEPLRRR